MATGHGDGQAGIRAAQGRFGQHRDRGLPDFRYADTVSARKHIIELIIARCVRLGRGGHEAACADQLNGQAGDKLVGGVIGIAQVQVGKDIALYGRRYDRAGAGGEGQVVNRQVVAAATRSIVTKAHLKLSDRPRIKDAAVSCPGRRARRV